MKNILIRLFILMVGTGSSWAIPGPLFDVSVNGSTLNIRTTISGYIYQNVGISILTAGYSFSNSGNNCRIISQNHYICPMSNTASQSLTLSGPDGMVNVSLCLTESSRGSSSCQNKYVSVISSMAYVVNTGNNTISLCPVNTDGSFARCTVSYAQNTLHTPLMLALNPEKTIAYIPNFSANNISMCNVSLSGALSSCTILSAPGAFVGPSGAAVNTAGDYLFVSNVAGYLSICQILTDGSIDSCTRSYGDDRFSSHTFDNAQSVSLNTVSGTNYVYVSTNANNISICPVSGGTIGTCVLRTGNTTFQTTQGVSFNSTRDIAYVSNYASTTVSICPLLNDGSLNVCSTSTGDNTFNFSAGTATNLFMYSPTQYGYIPNSGSDSVSKCTIASDGSLSACSVLDGNGTFSQPSGVTLKNS